ncbi:MAG: flagellar basal body rod protein FlgC [Pseudomonadota bacterium]
MSLLNVFDVSGSGMAAQTLRLNTTASNIANAESVAENPEDTYRARYPVFQATLSDQVGMMQRGQKDPLNPDALTPGTVTVPGVVESDKPLSLRYQPEHPYANDDGYVAYPNVSVVEEMANMISASRSFQINVEVMNTAKSLAERVLSLGQ